MSDTEIYGVRDLAYSEWHRTNSIKRFVGAENAKLLAMIDIDVVLYAEYEDSRKEPICLIETARDIGQSNKPSTITRRLAEKANIHAFTVLYTPSKTAKNPAAKQWPDIEKLRVKQIYPNKTSWKELSPTEWARVLLNMRKKMTVLTLNTKDNQRQLTEWLRENDNANKSL